MPFDFASILKQLVPNSPPSSLAGPLPAWLTESWARPGDFAVELLAFHAGRSSPPPKSRPGVHFDFYHDMVVRNASGGAGERPALRWWDAQGGWQTLSYAQLDARAGRIAGDWKAQGVMPGVKVCLFHQMGAELLIGLMAGLRLGACMSLLPPLGSRYVDKRLAALAPDFVSAEPHQAPLLRNFAAKLLREGTGAAPATGSHTYAAAAPVALLLSPLVDPQHVPVPLLADDAYVCALRDSILVHMLRPDDHLAAPGCHLLQHQPALLFSTLLRAATFLHLTPEALERDPSLLAKYPIRSLGLTPVLRDVFLRGNPPSLRNVDHWFRNPEEPFDWEAWRTFIQRSAMQNALNSNVLLDASAGGAVLASSRRRGEMHAGLWPGAGRPFTLLDPNMTGQPSPGESGVFALHPVETRPPGYIVLGRARGECLYVGTRIARREGHVFPTAEVIALVAELPFVAGVSVVPVPSGGPLQQQLLILLVFTGAEEPAVADAEAGARRQEINRLIERLLVPEFVPDRIELFPLFPRRKEGAVDDDWCAFQYRTGMLHQKTRSRMFRLLTDLRTRTRVAGPRRPGAMPGTTPT